MERKESQQIGDVLRLAFQENCMQDKLLEVKAASLWPSVVGRAIASECGKPFAAAGILTVPVANAALRQELQMNRSRIAREINRQLGKDVITDIRLISSPRQMPG